MEEISEHPLHTAAKEGKVMIARNILSEDKSACLKKDQDGRTALMWAVSSNHAEVATEIFKVAKTLSKFDIDEEDDAGWTCLHIACAIGNLQLVEIFINADANVDAKTNTGQTPLIIATSKLHVDIVRFLLEHKASARVKNDQNQTPLHRAAAVGSMPIVKIFIEAKSALNPQDSSGWTPMHHATAEGHGDVAIELAKSGADPQRTDVDGLTPLDVAADDKVRAFLKNNSQS